MVMRTRSYAIVAFTVLSWMGCDATGSRELETEYVVESVFVAGDPMPPLLLSRVGSLDAPYSFEAQAELGATITIRVSGAVANEEVLYEGVEDVPGLYTAADYAWPVLPLHRYDLTVQPAGSDEVITASTLVPDTFRVIEASHSALEYQSGDQLILRITPSEYEGRDQSYFIFVTESIEPFEGNLVPFARERYDNGDGQSLDDLRISSSPIVNEDNYDVNPDGTLSVRYPWIGINFYGPNILHINALDDNLYDFERSRSTQENGSTFGPGEIPNPLSHIRGAHGIFGSQARVSQRFTVVE